MKDMASKLTKEDLEHIGEYLVKKYPAIKDSGRSRKYSRDFEMDIRERIVRVEEELKNQREILNIMIAQMDKRFELSEKRFDQVDRRIDQIDKRFEQVDKRFEQIDKRFEQVDKRFEQVDKRFEDMQHYMDKRFSALQWMMGIGFTLLAALMGIFNFF